MPALLLAAGVAAALLSLPASADTARLTLDVATLSFPSADPDSVPQISAVENPVTVEVTVRCGNPSIADLTVLSSGDLLSGIDAIPIDRVSWTASGNGFTSGVLSRDDPQPVGQWFGKRVDAVGSLWFRLDNSWDYVTGSYSQTVVYTLTSY
jgi:hypothetical protein